MRVFQYLSSLLATGICSSAFALVIYSDSHLNRNTGDDRQEVYEAAPVYQDMARSVGAMFMRGDFRKTETESGTQYTIVNHDTLQDQGFCSEMRYASQPAPAACTGFLVAPNILVTAGHCHDNDSFDCENKVWVFDFAMKKEGEAQMTFSSENVYGCKRVIGSHWSPFGHDYTVIELDRSAPDFRKPLPFRHSGKAQSGTPLAMIGHPIGLPQKVTVNGTLGYTGAKKRFRAYIDAFGGNSGSPVINANTLEVEGILVASEEQDFVSDWKRGCKKINVCLDGECAGEVVTAIATIPELKGMGL